MSLSPHSQSNNVAAPTVLQSTSQRDKTFNSREDIADLIRNVDPALVQDRPEDLAIRSGFYHCQPDSKGRYCLEQEKVDKQALRNADTICFGGIYQLGDKLGQLAKAKVELLTQADQSAVEKLAKPTPKLPATYKNTLLYHSNVPKKQRFEEVYRWNSDKNYVSCEMQDMGNAIWNARFLNEQGHLLPPEKVKPLLIFTYSFGARMVEMLENVWREKLREANQSDGDMQRYFNRFRRVSIASAPDWNDFSKPPEYDGIAAEMEPRPNILNRNYISIDDYVPKYSKSFEDTFFKYMDDDRKMASAQEDPTLYAPAAWGKMDVQIFNHGVVNDSDQHGHSFSKYVDAIKAHDLEELQAFVSEIYPPVRGAKIA